MMSNCTVAKSMVLVSQFDNALCFQLVVTKVTGAPRKCYTDEEHLSAMTACAGGERQRGGAPTGQGREARGSMVFKVLGGDKDGCRRAPSTAH